MNILKNNKNNKYEAQALAIAMVVLVVSSIIGISIYSRSMKDRGLALEERASAEALEVSDVILDKLTTFPINEVISAIVEVEDLGEFDYEEGILLKDNRENEAGGVTALLKQLGVLEEARLTDLLDPICPLDSGANEYQLSLKQAEEGVYYEIRPGNVWSMPVNTLGESCSVDLSFAIRGDSKAGFSISKIYCNYDEYGELEGCKEYDYDDTENYCFSNGATCSNDNFLDNWNLYNEDDEEDILLGVENRDGYKLSEIRVKAIGATVGIHYEFEGECTNVFRMYQLRASANCSGVYRGKEILIPEEKWYNTIFDYVLFNGEGSI